MSRIFYFIFLLFLLFFPYLPIFWVPQFIQSFLANGGFFLYYLFLGISILVISIQKKSYKYLQFFIVGLFVLYFISPFLHHIDNKIIIWINDSLPLKNWYSPIVGVEYGGKCFAYLQRPCFTWNNTFMEFDSLVYSSESFLNEEGNTEIRTLYNEHWFWYHHLD